VSAENGRWDGRGQEITRGAVRGKLVPFVLSDAMRELSTPTLHHFLSASPPLIHRHRILTNLRIGTERNLKLKSADETMG
jgi:hypothetical protein